MDVMSWWSFCPLWRWYLLSKHSDTTVIRMINSEELLLASRTANQPWYTCIKSNEHNRWWAYGIVIDIGNQFDNRQSIAAHFFRQFQVPRDEPYTLIIIHYRYLRICKSKLRSKVVLIISISRCFVSLTSWLTSLIEAFCTRITPEEI